MKNKNHFDDILVHAKTFGKNLFVAFGKDFLDLHKIFTPDKLAREWGGPNLNF